MNDEAELSSAEWHQLMGTDLIKAMAIANDPKALDEAYRQLFSSVHGHAVLLDLIQAGGINHIRPPQMASDERAYGDGKAALVIEILERSGAGPIQSASFLQTIAKLYSLMERAHDNRNIISPSAGSDYPAAPEPSAGSEFLTDQDF